MNVYDFDKTILNDDSSKLFLLYCLRKYPHLFLSDPGEKIISAVLWKLGKGSLERMKEALFSVITRLPDPEAVVNDFWKENFSRVEPWYLPLRRDDDLVISASPEFLVRPATDRLGVRLLATPMSVATGCITGCNCKGEEKVRRFRSAFPDDAVEKFYSDSLSDTPLARLAEQAFLIVDHKPVPWPEETLR